MDTLTRSTRRLIAATVAGLLALTVACAAGQARGHGLATDVARCADDLGGRSDGNLALCADVLGEPCGDLYTDPLRASC